MPHFGAKSAPIGAPSDSKCAAWCMSDTNRRTQKTCCPCVHGDAHVYIHVSRYQSVHVHGSLCDHAYVVFGVYVHVDLHVDVCVNVDVISFLHVDDGVHAYVHVVLWTPETEMLEPSMQHDLWTRAVPRCNRICGPPKCWTTAVPPYLPFFGMLRTRCLFHQGFWSKKK